MINPTYNLASNRTYFVQIDKGAFRDSNYNQYDGIDDNTTWRFSINSASGDCECSDLDNCDLPLFIQTGDINAKTKIDEINLLIDNESNIIGNITNENVSKDIILTIDNQNISISLDEDGGFNITDIDLREYSNKDVNISIKMSDSSGYVFDFNKTISVGSIDINAIKLSPNDNSTDSTVIIDMSSYEDIRSLSLNITFDTNITKNQGNISVYTTTDSQLYGDLIDVESIEVGCLDDTTTCSKISIDPTSFDFSYGKKYYINVDSGSFKDNYGNIYKGIQDNSTWTFEINGTSGPCSFDDLDNCVLDLP